MNSPAPTTLAPGHHRGASRALRRLFLLLFLRGRTSRGLQRESSPKSVGQKLALTLFFYALLGSFALGFIHQPILSLAAYLHAMTFVLLGMFVATSAGEVLFNKEEGDILLHRPVTARELLWAKISVMVQVSLYLAGAFNLAGFVAGMVTSDLGWVFVLAHAISTVLEALFCTGSVVMTYQLCLRWFGRERLDGLMTTVQVFVSIAVIAGGQLLPRMMSGRAGEMMNLGLNSWWIALLPPAWFAGIDDLLAGRRGGSSWLLAALAVGATAAVLSLAFGKLARDYGAGLQTLAEVPPARSGRSRRRWLERLVNRPPLRWWLGDSISRAAFLLTVAYLMRDRDVKLRIYPGLAPTLILPVIFLFQGRGDVQRTGSFGVAFAGCYLALIPLLALNLLQFSQQWQAGDLFRCAPLSGPAPLWRGARQAVFCLLTLPVLLLFGVIAWLTLGRFSELALVLPGLILLPIYSLLPCLRATSAPLSMPVENAKSAGRGVMVITVMLVAALLSGVATFAWSAGWFRWLLLVESVGATGIYFALRGAVSSLRWTSME